MVASIVCVFLEYSSFGLSYCFSQTISALRIEIDNYIIQRQRTEEQLAANVSFKHESFLYLFVDNIMISFTKTLN